MPYDICVHRINRALQTCGLCERERAEKAEAELKGIYALTDEKCEWFYRRAIAAEAQVVALRGALEFYVGRVTDDDDGLDRAKQALSLPVPELAQAVQELIESSRWALGMSYGVRMVRLVRLQNALDRLDAAMGIKP